MSDIYLYFSKDLLKDTIQSYRIYFLKDTIQNLKNFKIEINKFYFYLAWFFFKWILGITLNKI